MSSLTGLSMIFISLFTNILSLMGQSRQGLNIGRIKSNPRLTEVP
jgi:hypothetical protein